MTRIAVDVKTAAEMIGVSEDTMRGYVERGLVPIVRLPSARNEGEKSRRVLISVSDLEAFIAANREAHAPDATLSEAALKRWSPKVRRVS